MQNNSITVLYDHQIFSMQKFGGISRYFSELYMQFVKTQGIEVRLTTLNIQNIYMKDILNIKNQRNLRRQFNGNPKANYVVNIIPSYKEILLGQYSVLHPTYYGCYYKTACKSKPIIITAHDFTHEKYPEFFIKPSRNYKLKSQSFQISSKIIAISENTKLDLINYYNVDPNKITVIYHGNSLKSSNTYNNKDPNEMYLPNRYILYVGARDGYKNFVQLLRAYAQMTVNDDNLLLVCAGGGDLKENEVRFINDLGLQNKIVHFQPSDRHLVKLYENALAFIFPSFYEGFGMPILEAMSCHCPVILSNRSALPEIAENAGVYFEPNDEDDIRKAIESVIYSDSKRKEMINKGLDRSEHFSWETTAVKTKEVYLKAIEEEK